MKKVKKLDYGSFAITVALANTILSLIILILFLPLLLITAMGPLSLVAASIAFLFVIIPIVSFISGLISGLLIALIYNLFLHKYVKIEVE